MKISNKHIQLFRPVYHNIKDITKNIADSLSSGWVGNGPKVKLLEERIATYLECKNVIMVNSGTAALHLAVKNTFDHSKKYVITTPNTFVATNMVLLYEGFVPIFVGIDENGNINTNYIVQLSHLYYNQIAGIMLVHYSGIPITNKKLDSLQIPIVEDCAHSFTAEYEKLIDYDYEGNKFQDGAVKVGNSIHTCCFSSHAVKPIPINEGGFITTNDNTLAQEIRKQIWFGIDKSTFERSTSLYKWEYDINQIGYKYHYNDIQAAIGLEQFKYIDEEHERRIEVAIRYAENFLGQNIRYLPVNSRYSYHFMPIFVKNNRKFIEKMSMYNIECGMHYRMNYHYPIFKNSTVYNKSNANQFEQTEVTLPFGLHLTNSDIDCVSEKAIQVSKEIENAN